LLFCIYEEHKKRVVQIAKASKLLDGVGKRVSNDIDVKNADYFLFAPIRRYNNVIALYGSRNGSLASNLSLS